MPNTYTQILVQIVFAVQCRENLIHEDIRERIEKYICGIVSSHKSKPLAISCNPDHTHVLIGLHPTVSISEMTGIVKANSSKWINKLDLIRREFSWQEGFGAFTYSKSQLDMVVKYILNQPEHHKRQSFKEEYLELLEKFEIEYDEKYLFEWI